MSDLPPKRPSRRRRWITLLIAISVAGWFYSRSEPPGIEGKTSDGQWRVRFLAAGASEANYLPDSQLWESARNAMGNSRFGPYLYLLPGTRNIRAQFQRTRTGAQPLAMVFRYQLVSGSFKSDELIQPDVGIHFVDSNGFTYPHHTESTRRSCAIERGETWVSESNVSFPRRDREFTVQLVERSRAQVLEFRIFNPVFQETFPEWPATALPASIGRDKFTLHLRGFDVDPESGDFKPRLEIEPRREGWTAEMYPGELEDATGNHGNRLSPWEPCWKLPVFLDCSADPDSPTSEQLKFDPVALPAKGASSVVPDPRPWMKNSAEKPDTLERAGTRIIGRTTVTIGAPQNWKGNPNVMDHQGPKDANLEALFEIDTRRMPQNVCILLAVHDQAGNELTAALPECAPEESPQRFALPFKAGDDVTSLSISLMISDRYFIDFFIAPPEELREKSLRSKVAGPPLSVR